jgi:hypothetical protein
MRSSRSARRRGREMEDPARRLWSPRPAPRPRRGPAGAGGASRAWGREPSRGPFGAAFAARASRVRASGVAATAMGWPGAWPASRAPKRLPGRFITLADRAPTQPGHEAHPDPGSGAHGGGLDARGQCRRRGRRAGGRSSWTVPRRVVGRRVRNAGAAALHDHGGGTGGRGGRHRAGRGRDLLRVGDRPGVGNLHRADHLHGPRRARP